MSTSTTCISPYNNALPQGNKIPNPHGNNAYTKQKIDRKKQCSTVFRQSLPSDHFHQDSLKSVDGIPFTPLCRTCRFAEVQASSNAILQIDGLQPHVPCDKKYIQ